MSVLAFQRVINIFKDAKYFVPSEHLTSLHVHSLLNLLIRCAEWCDSPLSQQVTLKDNCCALARMKLPMEQIKKKPSEEIANPPTGPQMAVFFQSRASEM